MPVCWAVCACPLDWLFWTRRFKAARLAFTPHLAVPHLPCCPVVLPPTHPPTPPPAPAAACTLLKVTPCCRTSPHAWPPCSARTAAVHPRRLAPAALAAPCPRRFSSGLWSGRRSAWSVSLARARMAACISATGTPRPWRVSGWLRGGLDGVALPSPVWLDGVALPSPPLYGSWPHAIAVACCCAWQVDWKGGDDRSLLLCCAPSVVVAQSGSFPFTVRCLICCLPWPLPAPCLLCSQAAGQRRCAVCCCLSGCAV